MSASHPARRRPIAADKVRQMFQRILVANRGEIALRVIRACKELGIEVVAVYSQADRDAPYLDLADRAICIGKAPEHRQLPEHPPDHRRRRGGRRPGDPPRLRLPEREPRTSPRSAGRSGFEFIGPPHEAIRKMGLKTEAKPIAAAAQVPCVPGSDGVIASDAAGLRLAATIGYPVLIKAAAGGGGKGMRVCRDEANLVDALQAARNEAEAAFKNASVYLEKFIDRPRHVEVQILADNHGKIVHCWDRDCSLQRRHQKLVEESPAPTSRSRSAAGSARPPSGWPRPPATSTPAPASSWSTPTTTSTSSRSTPASRSSTPSPRWSPASTSSSSRSGSPPGEPPAVHPGRDRHPRPCDRVPDQLRRPRQRLPPVARQDHGACGPGRARRPLGLARPGRLHGPAQLRLAARQADRPRPDPRRGPRHDAPGPRRAGHRGRPDHHPAAQADLPQSRLHRRPRRYDLGRARPDATAIRAAVP